MTTPRSLLVDLQQTRWYHCISGCVRGAFLLSEGEFDRKDWIEKRLETLSQIFSIAVAGFAILDNHLHVLCRLDPEPTKQWSNEQVARRWYELYPKRDKHGKPLPMSDAWLKDKLSKPEWIEQIRERLQNLGWMMKCLKEPLARLINREEKRRGTFFEGRYKSIAVLDEESLLTTCAYIDLNPVAAGIAATPEESPYTSVKQRVEHVAKAERLNDLSAAKEGNAAASKRAKLLEEHLWLCPIEDRRELDSQREGMLKGLTLGNYLLVLDYVGRLHRDGKAAISKELDDVFTRLKCDASIWTERINNLKGKRLMGRFMAATKEKLVDAAKHYGLRRIVNVHGCE